MTNDPLIGRQLANFRIARVIGRGGMGQIYFGEDVKLGRPVALKVIDTRYRGNPAYAERFVREARAVATWRHDNIIQIHYADDQDGLYYFVMEYIDGMDLGQLLARHVREGRQMPHAEVLRIGRAIAGALDYAHAKGVIHRDVKPSNVMVANDGRIVLTDFGLAMDVQQGSVGEVFGSSHYIAPEQARRSSDAVPQSDLYALGVMLYEMLTGIVPFDDPSPTTVALQHLTQAPPPPRQVNPSLSQAIEQVLLKALAKTPGERYRSGAELIAALEQAMQGKAKGGAKSPRRPRSLLGQESLVGHQLDEYRIEALLGRGGMAHIYRALDVPLNRYVALKVIDPPLRADPDYIQRFGREAQAIAQLDHPNIVSIHRSGDAEGLLYIVMQYIEGSNLDFVLDSFARDGEFIPLDQTLRLTREVCAALDYAHGKGVIHRDVKPSNIMVEPSGRAILTDFGLALLKTVGTQGKIFGSPHYISPEQAVSSARVVPQSDLYAVGVMLYQMLTGQLPFDADEALEVAMLHLTEQPRPPRSLRPELSPALETMVLKCLAKEPGDRYPTGAALVAALELAIKNSKPGLQAAGSRSIPQRVAAQLASQPPIQPPPGTKAVAPQAAP
ncbi:MAG TPA: serine/threonine-protein kinase, partial [Herpetosiphonaceae bacterium]